MGNIKMCDLASALGENTGNVGKMFQDIVVHRSKCFSYFMASLGQTNFYYVSELENRYGVNNRRS